MLSFELHYKVLDILEKDININDYSYAKCLIEVPKDIQIICYINSKILDQTEVGGYYKAKKAYLTSLSEVKDIEVSMRVDHIFESSKEEFESIPETIVRTNALIRKSKLNVLKHFGPMRTPTCHATAVSKNEKGNTFYIMLIGFHSRAKLLDNLGKACYADITGSLATRGNGKPCSIIIKDLYIRKEVY